MSKYFIDVICNKVWSSFELLIEVNHHTRDRKDEKEKSLLLSPGWLGEGLRIVGVGVGE